MDKYLLSENDGLLTRPSGKYAKKKLFYLQKYIATFEKSMRDKSWRKRNFIDLFSGPGKCAIRGTKEIVLGSPLLALTTEHPFTDYYFVDLDDKNIEALEIRSQASGIPQDRIHFSTGNANEKVLDIVTEIQNIDNEYRAGIWSSLNLAFLDPEGFELQWDTVAKLAEINKMDLIIHYSQQGVERMAEIALRSRKETAIDKFFGDLEWRRIFATCKDDPTGIHRPLIDYYKSKLKDLGYVEIKDSEDVWAEPLTLVSANWCG